MQLFDDKEKSRHHPEAEENGERGKNVKDNLHHHHKIAITLKSREKKSFKKRMWSRRNIAATGNAFEFYSSL